MQAIKLGHLLGVPWTQFFGFAFLASFILVEILIILAYFDLPSILDDEAALLPEHVLEEYIMWGKSLTLLDLVCGWRLGGLFSLFVFVLLVLFGMNMSFINWMEAQNSAILGEREMPHAVMSGTVVCLTMLTVTGMIILVAAIALSCLKFPRAARFLQVSFPDDGIGAIEADSFVVAGLLFSFEHLILSVFGYWTFYKPAGTVNPAATGAFG